MGSYPHTPPQTKSSGSLCERPLLTAVGTTCLQHAMLHSLLANSPSVNNLKKKKMYFTNYCLRGPEKAFRRQAPCAGFVRAAFAVSFHPALTGTTLPVETEGRVSGAGVQTGGAKLDPPRSSSSQGRQPQVPIGSGSSHVRFPSDEFPSQE